MTDLTGRAVLVTGGDGGMARIGEMSLEEGRRVTSVNAFAHLADPTVTCHTGDELQSDGGDSIV